MNFTTAAEIKARKLADDYIALKGDSSPSNYKDYFDWTGTVKTIFQNHIYLKRTSLTSKILSKYQTDLNISPTLSM